MIATVSARSLAEQFAPALPRASAAGTSLFTSVRSLALALSVLAHGAVVAVGVHAGRTVRPQAGASERQPLVELQAPELVDEPAEAEAATRIAEPDALAARATTRLSASPEHVDAAPTHAPSSVAHAVGSASDRATATPSPEPAMTVADAAPPRFVLPAMTALGTASATATPAALNAAPAAVRAPLASGNAATAPGSRAGVDTGAVPLSEREVDVAARLIAGTPPAYTTSAEAAGVEASVPVELVIDGSGAVTSAVPLAHVGYGLDEAALSAVRRYRFAPARRGGKAVAVRMRWVVRFELG